jgi:two-component system, OmpR family, phosphate regulon response regulator PhoB
MPDQITIILSTHNTQLIQAVKTAYSNIVVANIDAIGLDEHIHGPIYCFIDWMLPECSGLEMCHKLRMTKSTAEAHIVMIMETRDSDAQRRAIRAGADSYVLGPLTPSMLIQKLEFYSNTPRISSPHTKLTHGELTIDLDAYRVQYHGRKVSLPHNEFRILTHFIENPDKLLTRRMLIEMLGKNSSVVDERIVNVWVRRLRHTLQMHQVPNPLRTVRSKGYVLDSVSS